MGKRGYNFRGGRTFYSYFVERRGHFGYERSMKDWYDTFQSFRLRVARNDKRSKGLFDRIDANVDGGFLTLTRK